VVAEVKRRGKVYRCARCGTRRLVTDPGDIDHPINCKKCGFNLRASMWSMTDQ
jgi:DNA-directed RNA polymerase subunit RPC12/RpoP